LLNKRKGNLIGSLFYIMGILQNNNKILKNHFAKFL